MTKNLQDTLRKVQILLGKPHREFADTLKYYLDFFGSAKSIKTPNALDNSSGIIQTLKHKKITWVDIKNPSRKEISLLAEQYPFHPLHLEDCISRSQFPKIERNLEDKYLFLLLNFPVLNKADGKISISQICFFLGKNYLVTTHESGSEAVNNIFEACKENPKQREAYIDSSAAYLLYILVDRLITDLSILMQIILQEVDRTEDTVFDDRVSGVYEVGQLRQKIVSLRRMIHPLAGLMKNLSSKGNNFGLQHLSVYFEDIINRVEKIWETLEIARETVEIYKDADFIFSTEKTNRILAVLTIVFTLAIPATVIGTFYGMNISLPGGIQAGSWTFWGEFTTFIILLIVSIMPALLMSWYFRRRNWF